MSALTPLQIQCYFWFACIPARLILALLVPVSLLKWILPVISISFFYLYVSHSRLHSFESGGFTWWSNYRIVHAVVYLIALMVLMYGHIPLARYILVCDALIGIYLQLYIKPYIAH